MQTTEHEKEREGLFPHAPADSQNKPVTPVPVAQIDAKDDDPDEIFLKAVAEIDTQPLPQQPQAVCWPLVRLTLLCFCSLMGGTLIALLTYPTVTIDVVPVSRQVSLSTQLDLPTRALAPVTLTQALTAPTTGKGHQDARNATGTLTFYNGSFTSQSVDAGTVFTGSGGIQVTTDQPVTLPAARATNPPQFGEATVSAHAIAPGSAGNIAAGDITTTLANAILVKNSQFSGGQDARDYQAVAQADLDGLTAKLRSTLTEQMPQAFPLSPGEAVSPTQCVFTVTASHQPGEEAQTVTTKATDTCKGIAYNREELTQRATTLFTKQTIPGTNYQLVGDVEVQVISVTPLTVSCRGLWADTLSQDYEQFLAQEIAGDTPAQAKAYLMRTGFITRANVPGTGKLPQDPGHIHFQVFISI